MPKTAEADAPTKERHWLDNKFIKQVAEALAVEGTSVKDVADNLEVSRGQVALAKLRAEVPVKDRLTLIDDDDDVIAKAVKPLRDKENLSWGIISARLGVPESKVRAVFDPDSHGKGLRVGRGGRPADESNGSSASTSKPVKAPKGGAGKSEAEVNPDKKPLMDMTVAELKVRLTGQTITVGRGAKSEKIIVKKVQKLSGNEITLFDKDGKSRVVTVQQIVRVTR